MARRVLCRVSGLGVAFLLGVASTPWLASSGGAAGDVPVGCGWASGFAASDLDGEARAFVRWNDGSGDALYVGGRFTWARGTVVNNIARWDGTSWSALAGPSGVGTAGPDDTVRGIVYAMAVWDDGTGEALYVGGAFETAGGLPVNHVARWDGTSWSAVGAGLGTTRALEVWDDGSGEKLYAGGGGVARWNGVSWSYLPGLLPDQAVLSLAVWDDGGGEALYVGGWFTAVGGVTANHVARYRGESWSALAGPSGTGVSGSVNVLEVWDDGRGEALYAGGDFSTAGGISAGRIARWDGSAWSALVGPSGNGVDQSVYAMVAWDPGGGPGLYVGGYFHTAGGVTANEIARWDGTSWSALSGPAGNGALGSVWALTVWSDGGGEVLYAGGDFSVAGGLAASRIARWDGVLWSALPGPHGLGLEDDALAFAVWDDGTGEALYAGGEFLTAGEVVASRVARWDGTAWSALSDDGGTGVAGIVRAMAVWDDGNGPALYVGGSFTVAGGLTVNNVARWDGSTWSALAAPSGTGIDGAVYALAGFDDGSGPALFAGGWFTTAGGEPVPWLARWDGATFSPVGGPAGSGPNGMVRALTVFDDGSGPGLYAGGYFVNVGGVPFNRVARWDGVVWAPLAGPQGLGADNGVHGLTVWDDGGGAALYAVGSFTTAGGVPVNHVARWDGHAWFPLAGPGGVGAEFEVHAVAPGATGTGTSLFVAGWFERAGGVTANYIARWDGSAWYALPGPSAVGLEFYAYALAPWDDGSGEGMYVGGSFLTAGGKPSSGIARWSWCPAEVFADGFETGTTSMWSLTTP